jgi:hypothetical protein
VTSRSRQCVVWGRPRRRQGASPRPKRIFAALAVSGLVPIALPTRANLPPAGPHGFQSMAEKAEVRLGEPFGYTIEVRHDPADRYVLEGHPKLEPFEASQAHCEAEPPKKKDEAVTTCRMRLALYDLGEHDVPDVRLVGRGPAGERVLVVPGPRVKGVGVIDPSARVDELALRSLAPQVPLLVRSWRLLWWTLGAAAGAGLALAGWIAWKRWRRAAPVEALPLPPHVRFERRLSDLAAERLPQSGRKREYFFRLSEIVREYLGRIFAVNALDLTTAELVETLSRRANTIDCATILRWCERADVVKFARYEPSEEECDEALRYARELLEATRPKPEAVA